MVDRNYISTVARISNNEFRIPNDLIANLLTEHMGSEFMTVLNSTDCSFEGDGLIDIIAGVVPECINIRVAMFWDTLQFQNTLKQQEGGAISNSRPKITVTIGGTSVSPIAWHSSRPNRITVRDVMFVNACIKNTRAYQEDRHNSNLF